jgi:hypothetical protein
MRSLRRIGAGLIVGWCLPFVCLAETPEPPEISAALAWFDTLGFPDVTNCHYVRVTLGFSNPNIQPAKNTSCDGFLLSDDGKSFTVFFTESIRRESPFYARRFDSMTFARTSKGTPESQRVGCEPISLKEEADKAIEAWRKSSEKDSRDYGNYLSDQVSAFVLGWSCLQKGLGPQASDAFALALKFHALGRPSDGTLQEVLENHLVYILADRAVYDFADPKTRPKPTIGEGKPIMSRAELLTIFEKLSRDFPHTPLTEQIDRITGTLRQMAREDAGHHPKPLDQMTPQEQISEWIFRLRDQPGWAFTSPGLCEVLPERLGRLSGVDDSPKYPADHLLAFGFSAVPQLIDSLSDTRLSRAVDEGGTFRFHPILTVGECARQVLRRIAHRNFDYRSPDGSTASPVDAQRGTEKMVRDWWAEVQARGTDTLLVEGARKGDWDSLAQARELLKRHPDQAPAAIIVGIQHADREEIRLCLVSMLGQEKNETSAAFFRKEMVDESIPRETRMLAAQSLYWWGEKQVLPVMIAEWQKGMSGSVASVLEGRRDLGELTYFLFASGNPVAVKSVTEGFPKLPVALKFLTIDSLYNQRIPANPAHGISASDAKVSNALIDRMLVTALDDNAHYEGHSTNYDDVSTRDPRVCEMAAWKLSQRWPGKYPFKWTKSPADMDRQIAAMKTARREDE